MRRTIKADLPEKERKRWLSTAEHVGRIIPGCEHLKSEYSDFWSPGLEPFPEDLKQIKKDIKESVGWWLDHEIDEEDINCWIKQLNPKAKNQLLKIMSPQHRGFFETNKGQFPWDLAVPIPFIPLQKQFRNKTNTISNPIRRVHGKTSLIIEGNIATPEDATKFVALNQIRKRSRVHLLDENVLSFITSDYEIARELGKKGPSLYCGKDGEIIQSLRRLRSMTIHWEKGDQYYDGGLLHIFTNLKDTNKLKIYLDRFFLYRMFNQFIGINYNKLVKFYSLPGKQVNLFLFLSRFKSFNQYGTWDGHRWGMDIARVYELASLRNPNKTNIPRYFIRHDLMRQLKGLYDKGFIKKDGKIDEDDYLIIGEKDKKIGQKLKKK